MIHYNRFELPNGLVLLVHEDVSTPLVAVNVLYKVGSRNENPQQTGFAHLFEHLMFGGSVHAPSFDDVVQVAGGESNAFTNQDVTNFYEVVPVENLDAMLWLESDRMMNMRFTKRSLDVQRKVVVEEFKETCLNQPYGDVWHRISELAYTKHPYRWPVIGLVPQHIEDAQLPDVKAFFQNFYAPNNAVVVLAGNISPEMALERVTYWFGGIPRREVPVQHFERDEPLNKSKRAVVRADVPLDSLYLVFRMESRLHPDYVCCDLLSDILSGGSSGRLYRNLVKEASIFTEIDAYITGSIDPGLFVIEGKPAEGVTIAEAEAAVWRELTVLKETAIGEREMQKLKNQVESTYLFEESKNALTVAMNLAMFEALGDVALINDEIPRYLAVQPADIMECAQRLFDAERAITLVYEANTPAATAST